MSLNNGQTLTVTGQDVTRNGSSSSGAPWEDSTTARLPSTPTRKPKPVSDQQTYTICQVQFLCKRMIIAFTTIDS